MKEELTNLRSNLKEKDDYLNKFRILEDRTRRNNIHVKSIPDSENEEWGVTEEKLSKIIKDELDIENVVIERAHLVKSNNDDKNNDQNRKPPTAVANLLNFKDKQDILHEGKSCKVKNRRFFKRNFKSKKRTLE